MNDSTNPYIPPSAPLENRRALGHKQFAKSWFVFLLIATIGGGILGAIFGGLVGGVMGGMGATIASIRMVTAIAGLVVSLPLSYFTYKWTVETFLMGGPDQQS
jgi:membrane associated rhomboid family serine protease